MKMGRSAYLPNDKFELLLTAMLPTNRLAIEVSLATGLRIGDVLNLRSTSLRQQRFTVKEQKTGKARRVYLPKELRAACLAQAGRFYVFEGRCDQLKPRTRQAVYKDLKRVSKLYRLDGKKLRSQISPHSARKIYAVNEFHRSGSLQKVQELLNHSNEAVTVLYAMADCLPDSTLSRLGRGRKR